MLNPSGKKSPQGETQTNQTATGLSGIYQHWPIRFSGYPLSRSLRSLTTARLAL
jgi:hypothetical protein